jgi:hypothetical protein
MARESNPLQELTLTKDGKVSVPGKGSLIGKINPKELSNDELEFIIKTGKLPPRLMQQDSNTPL